MNLREKYEGRVCLELVDDFAKISSGEIQVPSMKVVGENSFRNQSTLVQKYVSRYESNMGSFWRHYCASIPFILEEQCRIGVAISQMAAKNNQSILYWETDSQDGTTGRTLSEESNGKVRTLTNGLHAANRESFFRLRRRCESKFCECFFCDITPSMLTATRELNEFTEGFDVIYENATFQFYDTNRDEQIDHLIQVLRNDGIVIFLEKLFSDSPEEYLAMEKTKDNLFKRKYFSEAAIEYKNLMIVSPMEQFQVSYTDLVYAITRRFSHVYLLWNSCNFYEIAASNSASNISAFLSNLPVPYVPDNFTYRRNLFWPTPSRITLHAD